MKNNRRASFFAMIVGLNVGGFSLEPAKMLTEDSADNLNICEAALSAPHKFTLKDAFVRLDSGKRERAKDVAKIDSLLASPPFAAFAGPRVIEFAKGDRLNEMIVRTADKQIEFSLPRTDFLGQVGAGSEDGRFVILKDDEDNRIHLLDLKREKVTLKLRSPTEGVGEDLALLANFSAGGSYLNVRSYNGVQAFHVAGETPRLEAEFGMVALEDDEGRARRGQAHYLPETKILVQHYFNGALRMIRPYARKKDLAFESPVRAGRDLFGLTDLRGRHLYAVRKQRYIDIFSLPGRRLLKTLTAAHQINELALSPDGSYLAYSSYLGEGVGLFALKDKAVGEMCFFELPEFPVDLLGFANNRELLVGNWSLAEAYAFLLQ